MPFTTIGCAEARRERLAQLTLCRECGIEMKCPTCEFGTAHVEGLEYSAFNEQAADASPPMAPFLMQNMHFQAGEHFKAALNIGDTRSVVQLISTLFEIAAAMAGIDPEDASAEDLAKLDILRRHAVEGVNLIDPGSEQ